MIRPPEYSPDICPASELVGEKKQAVAVKEVIALPEKQNRLGRNYGAEPQVFA
jgi:hypothetical protein